jgi:hypothetical protein
MHPVDLNSLPYSVCGKKLLMATRIRGRERYVCMLYWSTVAAAESPSFNLHAVLSQFRISPKAFKSGGGRNGTLSPQKEMLQSLWGLSPHKHQKDLIFVPLRWSWLDFAPFFLFIAPKMWYVVRTGRIINEVCGLLTTCLGGNLSLGSCEIGSISHPSFVCDSMNL